VQIHIKTGVEHGTLSAAPRKFPPYLPLWVEFPEKEIEKEKA